MVHPQINDQPPFQTSAKPPTVIVMAKQAIPGKVKTRLIGELTGSLTAQQAANVHLAMLNCIVERVETLAPDSRLIAAFDGPPPYESHLLPTPLTRADSQWELMDQGQGALGERMKHVWRQLGAESVIFLGADTPDAPLEEVLQPASARNPPSNLPGNASERLQHSTEIRVGPTTDGGYWTLAAASYQPILLDGIDWGTDRVYDQTLARAAQVSLRVEKLTTWSDVDEPDDLAQLRRRLETAKSPSLIKLAQALERIAPEPLP